VDEYANENPQTAGEVYRKIRQYKHVSNTFVQNRWWYRPSPNKAKRLGQPTSQDNAYLCAAFDGSLAIPDFGTGPSPQDTERHPAVLSEQAQRAVFERQEADDLLFDTLLFDTPYTLEDPEDQEIGEVQEKPTSECPAVTYCQDGELSFHAYDRGNWSRTDTVFVSSDNPHEPQSIADRMRNAEPGARMRASVIVRYGR
jgi:hypothetical protein